MKHVKMEEAPRFEPVPGAEMALIGDGADMTLTRIYINPGSVFPDHSHPNEQIGTCIQGVGVLTSGGRSIDVKPGVTWTIPAGEPHDFVAKGDTPVIIFEVWSPPREDYRAKANLV